MKYDNTRNRYTITASNAEGSSTRTRGINGMWELPKWVYDFETWPNLSIITRSGHIKYQRINGIETVDETKASV